MQPERGSGTSHPTWARARHARSRAAKPSACGGSSMLVWSPGTTSTRTARAPLEPRHASDGRQPRRDLGGTQELQPSTLPTRSRVPVHGLGIGLPHPEEPGSPARRRRRRARHPPVSPHRAPSGAGPRATTHAAARAVAPSRTSPGRTGSRHRPRTEWEAPRAGCVEQRAQRHRMSLGGQAAGHLRMRASLRTTHRRAGTGPRAAPSGAPRGNAPPSPPPRCGTAPEPPAPPTRSRRPAGRDRCSSPAPGRRTSARRPRARRGAASLARPPGVARGTRGGPEESRHGKGRASPPAWRASGASTTSFNARRAPRRSASRSVRRSAMSESPPSEKKSSWMPIPRCGTAREGVDQHLLGLVARGRHLPSPPHGPLGLLGRRRRSTCATSPWTGRLTGSSQYRSRSKP